MRILGVLGISALLTSVSPPDAALAEHAGLSVPTATIRESVREWRDSMLAAVKKSINAATPAPPKIPDLEFPSSIPMLLLVATATLIALALAAFIIRLSYLKLMAILADARVALEEKRSNLASAAPASSSTGALTISEIEDMLAAGFPEIERELRSALARAIAAAAKDKSAG